MTNAVHKKALALPYINARSSCPYSATNNSQDVYTSSKYESNVFPNVSITNETNIVLSPLV